jgi:hypothetical protein
LRTLLLLLLSLAACSHGPEAHPPLLAASTFAEYGNQVVLALKQDLWTGGGQWSNCDGGCGHSNKDWGNDALTFVLYLRWLATHDSSLVPMFRDLTESATSYGTLSCNGVVCFDWSDMPEWDAVANAREFEVTGERRARELAETAYRHVANSNAYRGGACPEIRFQRPGGGGGGLKTLETDSNAIKAAMLLWTQTGNDRYLRDAAATYQAVRPRPRRSIPLTRSLQEATGMSRNR